MTRNLPVDADRIWADLMALADITDPGQPYTRRSFSPLFASGRDWLKSRFEDAGLTTRIDAAGNLIGRREGTDPKAGTIAVGSHSDTVPSGGRFDGTVGVVAGLEIARALQDAKVELRHAFEAIDFLAEEPSEYGLSCVGSRGMTGALTADMLALQRADGETLRAALGRVGGRADTLEKALRSDLRAFLEIHIEQGIVLESKKIDLGLVTSIAGVRRLEIVFEGAADHAGTTPIDMRRDALVAAARTVSEVRTLAERLAAESVAYFVATVGVLDVAPNAANVVPGRSRLVVDIRAGDASLTERFVEALEIASARFAKEAAVERVSFRTLSDGSPVVCDSGLRDALREGAVGLGFSTLELASGAGHDAAFMSRICPSAMLFIPCRGGRSHAPEEWADKDAVAAGAAILLQAVTSLDRALALPLTLGAK